MGLSSVRYIEVLLAIFTCNPREPANAALALTLRPLPVLEVQADRLPDSNPSVKMLSGSGVVVAVGVRVGVGVAVEVCVAVAVADGVTVGVGVTVDNGVVVEVEVEVGVAVGV